MQKNSFFFLAIGATALLWPTCSYSYQYASSYKVFITLPGETQEHQAGIVTRQPHSDLPNRYSSVLFRALSITHLADQDKVPGINAETLSDDLKAREAVHHYCTSSPLPSSGHPIDILKTLCSRTQAGEITVSANSYSMYHLTNEISIQASGVLFSDTEGSSILSKSYSYGARKLPTYEEVVNNHQDELQIRDHHPTRKEINERNQDVPESQREIYDSSLAGKPFRRVEYVVKENRISGHKETKITYLHLPRETIDSYYEKFASGIPHVLFLSSADEEHIHCPRHIALPLPLVLLENEQAITDCTRPFEIPTIKVESISPSPEPSFHTIKGRLATYIKHCNCIPERVKKLRTVQKHTGEQTIQLEAYQEKIRGYISCIGAGNLAAAYVTENQLLDRTKLVSQASTALEADCADNCLEGHQPFGQKVTVVYSLDTDATHWQQIAFYFHGEDSTLTISTIAFRADTLTAEQKRQASNARRQQSARAGADNYDDIKFFGTGLERKESKS